MLARSAEQELLGEELPSMWPPRDLDLAARACLTLGDELEVLQALSGFAHDIRAMDGALADEELTTLRSKVQVLHHRLAAHAPKDLR